MILSDVDLRARLRKGDLVIGPLEEEELQIQPASIDVRLSPDFLCYRPSHVACLDPLDPETLKGAVEKFTIPTGEPFVLHPGEFALGSTIELVKIPADLVARVEGRSSVGRLAIVVHATAGFIDPGFEGQITLELSNIGRIPVRLYPGMRIAQIVCHELKTPSARPYGPGRGSHYHGQMGPVVSRIGRDSMSPEQLAESSED